MIAAFISKMFSCVTQVNTTKDIQCDRGLNIFSRGKQNYEHFDVSLEEMRWLKQETRLQSAQKKKGKCKTKLMSLYVDVITQQLI